MIESPLIINSGKNTWSITKEKIKALPVKNHEEADIRSTFNELCVSSGSYFCKRDTRVFTSVVCFRSTRMFPPPMVYETDSNLFINITTYKNLGGEISEVVPQLHAINVCNSCYTYSMFKRSTILKSC